MEQLNLFVPDRFDMLQRRAPSQLENIVIPIEKEIKNIKSIHKSMIAAGRGDFIILRGDSGSGKSTFLHTLPIFLEGVEVNGVSKDSDVSSVLENADNTEEKLRVVVIEGREALRDSPPEEIERTVHSINQFLRSEKGENTLIVWPVNADDLVELLIETAKRVGADSLLGVREEFHKFQGPPFSQFVEIANKTIATLNQGASLADLGVSEERAEELKNKSPTLGYFLGLIREELLKNQEHVETLLESERCRLWVVVAAGNDPDGDIAGLTRGAGSTVDIERLVSATNANIVQDLKRFPDKLGILGTVLDAKLLFLPSVSALSIARNYSDQHLANLMTQEGLAVRSSKDALDRLEISDLGKAVKGVSMGTRSPGAKPGSNTVEAFKKLSQIASRDDAAVNRAIGNALISGGYIKKFEEEKRFGRDLSLRTDLLCKTDFLGDIRLELMWRKRTGRADIANYVLNKLYYYGKAIGFLDE